MPESTADDCTGGPPARPGRDLEATAVVSTVLVVDDEPDVRLVARVILQAAGYEVEECVSGEDALSHLEAAPVPDAVLLDVRMPGIDGWEVLRRLRNNPTSERVPVVVFTADLRLADDAPYALEDGDFFLAKPFDPDDLVGLIRRATQN